MPDPRFFPAAPPMSLARLAEISGAALGPGADREARFENVASLQEAGPRDVSFLDNRKYAGAFASSRAGACCIHPDMASRAPRGMALLLSAEPYRAYALVAQAFHPDPVPPAGRHASAVIDATASVGDGVVIEAGAVIGARAEIGDRCRVGANAVIGAGVVLGAGTWIGAGATLSHCLVGRDVRIFPGARIGQDGFGYALGKSGPVKVPQLGRVIIHDGVEIGANATIDRGAGPDTVIGAGTIIDNLVQIGHNVTLGKGCVVVAQVGISGSTRVGNHVMMGGQAGLTGHLVIGDGAQVAAQAGVMRDIAPGGKVGGSPAVAIGDWHRQTVALSRLAHPAGGRKPKPVGDTDE